MKRIIPVLAILLLVGLLAFFNRSVSHSMYVDHDEDDDQQTSQKASSKPLPDVPLPHEIAIEAPDTAKYRVVIAWEQNDIVRNSPGSMQKIFDAMQTSVEQKHGKVALDIVNLAVPVQKRFPLGQTVQKPGLYVNGSALVNVDGKRINMTGDPGIAYLRPENMSAALAALK